MNKETEQSSDYVIQTVDPVIEFKDGQAVLSFFFSNALFGDSDGLPDILAFAEKVATSDEEATLTVKIGFENIIDGTLDGMRVPGHPQGEIHMSEDSREEVDRLKAAFLKVVEKIDQIKFDSEESENRCA